MEKAVDLPFVQCSTSVSLEIIHTWLIALVSYYTQIYICNLQGSLDIFEPCFLVLKAILCCQNSTKQAL